MEILLKHFAVQSSQLVHHIIWFYFNRFMQKQGKFLSCLKMRMKKTNVDVYSYVWSSGYEDTFIRDCIPRPIEDKGGRAIAIEIHSLTWEMQ